MHLRRPQSAANSRFVDSYEWLVNCETVNGNEFTSDQN